jgi:hypothetical protein
LTVDYISFFCISIILNCSFDSSKVLINSSSSRMFSDEPAI